MNIEPISMIPTAAPVFDPAVKRAMASPAVKPVESSERAPKERKEPFEAAPKAPVNRIEDYAIDSSLANHRVNFSVHEGSGRSIIRVVDRQTREVINEFPKEQVVEVTERMKSLMGLFFDKDV